VPSRDEERILETLRKLNELRERGLISEQEYLKFKNRLLEHYFDYRELSSRKRITFSKRKILALVLLISIALLIFFGMCMYVSQEATRSLTIDGARVTSIHLDEPLLKMKIIVKIRNSFSEQILLKEPAYSLKLFNTVVKTGRLDSVIIPPLDEVEIPLLIELHTMELGDIFIRIIKDGLLTGEIKFSGVATTRLLGFVESPFENSFIATEKLVTPEFPISLTLDVSYNLSKNVPTWAAIIPHDPSKPAKLVIKFESLNTIKIIEENVEGMLLDLNKLIDSLPASEGDKSLIKSFITGVTSQINLVLKGDYTTVFEMILPREITPVSLKDAETGVEIEYFYNLARNSLVTVVEFFKIRYEKPGVGIVISEVGERLLTLEILRGI